MFVMLVNDILVNQIRTLSWCQLLMIQVVLFYNIEKEPEESCLYKRLKIDYNYGLGRIYTVEEIEKAKHIAWIR